MISGRVLLAVVVLLITPASGQPQGWNPSQWSNWQNGGAQNGNFDACGCDKSKNEGWRAQGKGGCQVGSTTSDDEAKCCYMEGCAINGVGIGIEGCIDCGHMGDITLCATMCVASPAPSTCMPPVTGNKCDNFPCTIADNCNNSPNVDKAEWDSNYCECVCDDKWTTDTTQTQPPYTYCTECDPKYEQTQCKSCAASRKNNFPTCDELDCPVPTVNGALSTCTPNAQGVECAWTPNSGYTCDKAVTYCTRSGWDFPSGPTCSPDCFVEDVTGATLSSGCTAGGWVGDGASCTYIVQDGYTCESGAKNPGDSFDVTCSGGQPVGGNICKMSCNIPVIEGATSSGSQAAHCIEGQPMKSGAKCNWSQDQYYTCIDIGMQQCNDGAMVSPVCARPCDLSLDAGVTGSGDPGCDMSGKVVNGSLCTFTANPSYTCTGTGMNQCVDGTWRSALPSCAAGCTISPMVAATSSCPAGPVNDGQSCTWTENNGYSCDNTGIPITCVNGQWDATLTCFSDCTLTTVQGTSVSSLSGGGGGGAGACAGPIVKNGTSCLWSEDRQYTCTDMGIAVCIDGEFKNNSRTIDPTCVEPCEVLPVVGATSHCALRTYVRDGTSCRWTTEDGYKCGATKTTDVTCVNGNWNKQVTCEPTCFIAVIPGAEISGAGCAKNSSIDPGTTCTWSAAPGYSCSRGIGDSTCQNGAFTIPVCSAYCSLPTVDGASVTGTGCAEGSTSIPDGSVCTWTQDAGASCSGLVSTTCSGGTFSDPPPTCAANCPVTIPLGAEIVGSTPCDGVSAVVSGTTCTWQAASGFTCTNLVNTCNQGVLDVPVCKQQCRVTSVTGISSTCSGLVDNLETCTWTAESGYSCVHPDSVCQDGMFVPPAPTSCQSDCTVPVIAGALPSMACTGVGLPPHTVPHGTVCTWTQNPTCVNVQPTTCVDGSWDVSFSCTDDCLIPVISGATCDCTEGQTVTHGTSCTWSQDNFYTCTNIGSVSCTSGVLPPNPQCQYTACSLTPIVGARIANPMACSGVNVAAGTACIWEAEPGFSCVDATNGGALPPAGFTCQNGAFSGTPTCSYQCPVPVLAGAEPDPSSSCSTMLDQDDGTSCVFIAKSGYSCPSLANGPLVCSNSQFTTVDCYKECVPPSITGVTSNCSGNAVPHGEYCTWTANPQFNCADLDTSVCLDGSMTSVPTCAVDCIIPSKSGVNYTATNCGPAGSSVANGTICPIVASDDFTCTGTSDPALCLNGRFVYSTTLKSTAVVCNANCPVQSFTGTTSNCSGTSSVQHGRTCQWAADNGYTCTGDGSFICQSGVFSGLNVTCSPDCAVQEYTGTTLKATCTAGTAVSVGQVCRWETMAGYSCNDATDTDIACTANGEFAKRPECHPNCPVPDVDGATGNCTASVNNGVICSWTQDPGYTCTDLDGHVCHNGLLPFHHQTA